MVDETKEEKIIRIRKKLAIQTLYMDRVPHETKQDFIRMSKESCGDYGLTLKMLVDTYFEHMRISVLLNKMDTKIDLILNNINQPQQRISKYEQQFGKKE